MEHARWLLRDEQLAKLAERLGKALDATQPTLHITREECGLYSATLTAPTARESTLAASATYHPFGHDLLPLTHQQPAEWKDTLINLRPHVATEAVGTDHPRMIARTAWHGPEPERTSEEEQYPIYRQQDGEYNTRSQTRTTTHDTHDADRFVNETLHTHEVTRLVTPASQPPRNR